MGKKTNENYFSEYTNLQRVKHALIREYLSGWFPKLGLWSEKIVYLDTHAGRGEHSSGENGSPVVALDTLLSHSARQQILKKSEAFFGFIEHDDGNVDILNKAIEKLGELPENVQVKVSKGNCYQRIESLVADLKKRGKNLAPAFVFIDPYGFKVPCSLLNSLLSVGRVELFVNVIWRELHMGITLARAKPNGGMAVTITEIFGSEKWKDIDLTADVREREDAAIDLLCEAYGAKWATSMRMLGDNGATRYMLVHFTNHRSGRDLMKDCMWKVCPDGGFYARRSDNPSQSELITTTPDLKPLEDFVVSRLAMEPLRWSQLSELNLERLHRDTHLNQVLRQLRKDEIIVASEYDGRFSKKSNPLLSLKDINS